MTKRARELAEEADGVDECLDANNNLYSPDIGKEALNSLICRVEWRWILSVMVGEAVHELHVEVCVRVTNRQQNFLREKPPSIDKGMFDAAHGPRRV